VRKPQWCWSDAPHREPPHRPQGTFSEMIGPGRANNHVEIPKGNQSIQGLQAGSARTLPGISRFRHRQVTLHLPLSWCARVSIVVPVRIRFRDDWSSGEGSPRRPALQMRRRHSCARASRWQGSSFRQANGLRRRRHSALGHLRLRRATDTIGRGPGLSIRGRFDAPYTPGALLKCTGKLGRIRPLKAR
jgi:hypothetical protein